MHVIGFINHKTFFTYEGGGGGRKIYGGRQKIQAHYRNWDFTGAVWLKGGELRNFLVIFEFLFKFWVF